MPLLASVAKNLSNNDLIAGVVEEIIDRDQLFAQIPFTRIDGKAYVYNREDPDSWDVANPNGNLIEPQFTDVGTVIPESAAKTVEVVTQLRTLIGDVDVDKFLQSTMSDTNDQRAIQIAQKAKALGRKFRRALVQGDHTVDALSFDGIGKLSKDGPAYQTISAGTNGNALSFSMLDELLDAVPYGADAIIMTPSVLRAYRAALRAAGLGGSSPEVIMIHNFGLPVPAHNGVPILINEFLPKNETQGSSTTTTSVYAVRFNEVDGLHGLYGGDAAGIVVEDLGTVQNKDATRTRLKWYCGLALKSNKSLARIKGITNV